jgi:hypothetical protein
MPQTRPKLQRFANPAHERNDDKDRAFTGDLSNVLDLQVLARDGLNEADVLPLNYSRPFHSPTYGEHTRLLILIPMTDRRSLSVSAARCGPWIGDA